MGLFTPFITISLVMIVISIMISLRLPEKQKYLVGLIALLSFISFTLVSLEFRSKYFDTPEENKNVEDLLDIYVNQGVIEGWEFVDEELVIAKDGQECSALIDLGSRQLNVNESSCE